MSAAPLNNVIVPLDCNSTCAVDGFWTPVLPMPYIMQPNPTPRRFFVFVGSMDFLICS